MDCLRQEKDGSVVILIYVQPRSSKNAVQGVHDGALKIRTTAPPVEGKANTAIIALLADLFDIPKSAVSLVSGAKSRNKNFRLHGITMKEATAILTPIEVSGHKRQPHIT
jgi:uncharacterized protein (TIGR00251 family)